MLEKDGMNGFYPYDRLIYTWKNLLATIPTTPAADAAATRSTITWKTVIRKFSNTATTFSAAV